MPGPAVYVVVVVAGVAAGVAFKEFVYDPHIAPKFDEWAQTYAAYRKDRQRRRAPHAHKQSLSDDEDDHSTDRKSSVELESMVERGIHNLGHDGVLRHRKPQHPKETEILEKPNVFIPFEPLSPAKASPSPIASHNDAALPIGRLSTPALDQKPSSSNLSERTTSPQSQVATDSLSSVSRPQSQTARSPGPESTATSNSLEFDPALSEPAAVSRPPSRIASTYDFILRGSGSESPSTLASRSITPSSDSRATTPFTDARSEASVDFMSSDGASSDAELMYATDSEDAVSVISHIEQDTRQHRDSEYLHIPRVNVRSDAGSEDWERVSDAGR